jgi:dienelactone hydrolase
MLMKLLLAVLLPLLWVALAQAALQTREIEYQHQGTVLQGYLAYDDSLTGKQPGVLLVHEWKGHNKYVRKRAEQMANLGYVAFALDMYGKGVQAKTIPEAVAMSNKYKNDRPLMRARAAAGLEVLRSQPQVDRRRIAAIGYCFGGTTVLELARSGANLSGVVSFHGGLSTPNPRDARNMVARVLVLHGADDPNVKQDEVDTFIKEMRDAKADWQLIEYGGAVHSFTNPEAGSDPSKGAAYNEKADHRSWEAMRTFFNDIFQGH